MVYEVTVGSKVEYWSDAQIRRNLLFLSDYKVQRARPSSLIARILFAVMQPFYYLRFKIVFGDFQSAQQTLLQLRPVLASNLIPVYDELSPVFYLHTLSPMPAARVVVVNTRSDRRGPPPAARELRQVPGVGHNASARQVPGVEGGLGLPSSRTTDYGRAVVNTPQPARRGSPPAARELRQVPGVGHNASARQVPGVEGGLGLPSSRTTDYGRAEANTPQPARRGSPPAARELRQIPGGGTALGRSRISDPQGRASDGVRGNQHAQGLARRDRMPEGEDNERVGGRTRGADVRSSRTS